MSPVADHPIHPLTVEQPGTLWGCNNSKRTEGYWVPVRPEAPDSIAALKRHLHRWQWVRDRGSTACQYDHKADDPKCAGCVK